MTIKHLVMSGGGPTIIQTLGAIQYLEKEKFFLMSNIVTIYGTSAGAIIGILLCLKFDWETLIDYIIKRPWHEVFPIKVQNILDAYTKKGIFDKSFIEKCFKPLFDAKDLSMNITLKEFYEYSKIEIHLFSFEINNFIIEDISYKTHPDITVMNAIHMSCALPIILTPVCLEDKCFIDGGMVSNYPLQYCIDSSHDPDEILGIKNEYNNRDKNKVDSNSTLLDFIMNFLFKLIYSLSSDNKQPYIKNEVVCNAKLMNLEILKTALSCIETRKELFQSGIDSSIAFLEKLQDSI
jgi:predicted acylesterase/phospholipase RssA